MDRRSTTGADLSDAGRPARDTRSTGAAVLTWTYDDNVTGWGALLGENAGGDTVSLYAAAAVLTI